MDRLNVLLKDDNEPPEPSPQIFEISYNDDFPIAKKRSGLGRLRTISAISEVPEGRSKQFSFSSLDSISVEPDDDYRPLNHGLTATTTELSVKEANDKLLTIIQPLFEEIFDPEMMTVRYNKMADSSLYNQYIHFSRELQRVDPASGSVEERLAFFLNVYNMMVLHMCCKFGPPQDLWERRKFVNTTYYQIHVHKYSLHSILNGILRNNRRGHGMLWKPFGKEDLRLPLVLPMCNPLIHFALIGGTKSSPILRCYSDEHVWEEIRQNAVAYLLNDKNLLVDPKRQLLHIPKVFKWFMLDFGGSQEKCLDWILKTLQEDQSEKAEILREMVENEDFLMEYTPYDWEFNGAEPEEELTRK